VRPVDTDVARRDLWPAVVTRIDAPPEWRWLDLSLAAAIVIVLLVFPEWLLALAYHF
jgi:hypothetical protein